jgi:predicted RNA-binding Zn ribbon-like protein
VLFAHDTERALGSAAALVNAADLDDAAALARFTEHWEWTGSRAGDEAELAQVQALRPRLRELWLVSQDEAVVLVNGMLTEAGALPQLVSHDGWGYHLHATPPDAALHVRMMVEAAMAMVDVIRQGEQDRLRICAADGCDDVLVDLSKNRSRRFGPGCGNRAHVAAYRARARLAEQARLAE